MHLQLRCSCGSSSGSLCHSCTYTFTCTHSWGQGAAIAVGKQASSGNGRNERNHFYSLKVKIIAYLYWCTVGGRKCWECREQTHGLTCRQLIHRRQKVGRRMGSISGPREQLIMALAVRPRRKLATNEAILNYNVRDTCKHT